MDKKIDNSEIDLLEFILTLWNNKYKIILITFIFALVMLIYQSTQKKPILKFNALTDIMPITNFDEVKYEAFNFFIRSNNFQNSYELFQLETNNNIGENFTVRKIDKTYLIDLFIDQIRKKDFIKIVIEKSKLIKKEDYINNVEYENDINQLVQSIEIIEPNYSKENGKPLSNWRIKSAANDILAWINFLKLLNVLANQEIQSFISNNFENYKNSRRKMHNYKIEDIEIEISNALENYERDMSMRLSFLIEQAAIARKLDISKANNNTRSLETQTFSTESGIINYKTEMPYYMRGYEIIEKEIDLIKKRIDPERFSKNLLKLKSKKQVLMQNKDIQRMQNIFEDTPILKVNEFSAARIMFDQTIYNKPVASSRLNKLKMTFLASIIGFIFATFYVMFSVAIQKRNKFFKS